MDESIAHPADILRWIGQDRAGCVSSAADSLSLPEGREPIVTTKVSDLRQPRLSSGSWPGGFSHGRAAPDRDMPWSRARPWAGEPACRPGSVPPLTRGGGHPSGTAVAGSLVRSTREHRAGRPRSLAQGTSGSPLDLAPGGVYRAAAVTCGAGGLLHHRFTLTPASRRRGGLFSVALSRGSPRVGVTDHPALWSPDLPHRACARRDRPAGSPVLRIRRWLTGRRGRPHPGPAPGRVPAAFLRPRRLAGVR
jgi:hypothetical protein